MTEPTAAWQLPDGVDELLPADAWRVDQLRRQFTDGCRRSGFELVMPPLIEYIDALLTGTGEATSLQTFKVVDQQSGRTLGIRADMTPQVARMDAHVLRQDAPSRLCYTGTVLRARTDGYGGSRTPQQFGAEVFGHASAAADIEIIRLMLDTANLAGLDSASVVLDLGHVGVFQGLIAAAGLTDAQEASVFSAMHRGSLPDLQSALSETDMADGIQNAFMALLDLRGGADVIARASANLLSDETVKDLPDTGVSSVKAALQTVSDVIDAIERSHPDTRIVVDLAELRGYRYHTGMLFATYTQDGDVIARGGRYDAIGRAFGRDRPATGFSGDLTQLARLASAADASGSNTGSDAVFVPHMASMTADDETSLWAEVRRLRAAGQRVILALPDDANDASAYACTQQLVNRDNRWLVESITR